MFTSVSPFLRVFCNVDYFVKLKVFGTELQSQQLVKSTRPKPEEEVTTTAKPSTIRKQ